MTHITCTYPSSCLGANVTFQVLLPKARPSVIPIGNKEACKPPYPVLYLFHGALDDGETWIQNTNISTLVDTYNIAVVLPSVGNSFYLDSPKGQKYFKFVSEELFNYVKETFPVSKDSDKTFVGGCSMGGYGAFYSMLKKPEQYKKAFCLSGALDIKGAALFVKYCGGFLPSQFDKPKELPGSEWDLSVVLEENADKLATSVKPFYMVCGKLDPMFENNQLYASYFREKGLLDDFKAYDGTHDWTFWNEHLEECISWMLK